MYILLTGAEIDTWNIFPLDAWITLLLCVLIVFCSISFITARRIVPAIISRTTTGLATILVIATIFTQGSVPADRSLRTDYENTLCKDSNEGTLCVWKEDAFKMDDLQGFLQRTYNLRSAAELPNNPIIALEPGIPLDPIQNPAEIDENEYSFISIFAFGGTTPSWPAAQSFAFILQWSDKCSPESDEQYAKTNLLFDLLTNFIYGDIDYNGFSISNQKLDSTRLDYSQELAKLSEKEQLTRLASALASVHATCSYNPEELLTHA